MRSIADIQAKLPWNAEQGLTAEGVAQSRQLFGGNRLTPLPREPIWKKFLEKFDEPIIKILLAAALLSMVVDLFRAAPVVGTVGLGLLAVLVAGALVFRKAHWVPTLLFAAAMALFTAGLAVGHPSVEGLAVMLAVILATGVAFASEYKSDREFELLNERKESLQSKVVRAGQFHTVDLEQIVVGDVVLLEMGDEIPADGRLLKGSELCLDQSLMTGESEAVRKFVEKLGESAKPQAAADGPDNPGCLFRGTQVVDGSGQMLVTEVGDDTYLGQIARRLTISDEQPAESGAPADEKQRIQHKLTIDKHLTPLQLKLKHLAELISKVGYLAAILVFLAQLVRGIMVGEIVWPADETQALNVLGELVGYFVTMVIIIVVAVPEGLPMSVTVSLALAMRKMTRANTLVRQLVACETIGSATVICSDKTGTLTQNKMRVELISWDEEVARRENVAITPDSFSREPLASAGSGLWIALNAAVNSTANLEEKEGKLITVGSSTEGALLHWMRDNGVDYCKIRGEFEPLYQLHFSSERKRMTTVIRSQARSASDGSALVALIKGAPEWVLEHCRSYLAADGTVQPMTTEKKEKIRQLLMGAARQAMRTLAFAHTPLPPETPCAEEALHNLRDSLEKDLIYAGFVAIRDPLRDDVKEAIDQCRHAGIAVKMVTGDNVETARAIGAEIGLLDDAACGSALSAKPQAAIDTADAPILTSPRFNEMTDEELKQHLPKLRILARAKPLDKFRLVRLLQELGEVVAVTGDGTNDAPALKKADVGLAMGIAGTEVSKEASKIVLLDDAFSTIVRAVQWGRSLYENIQRFIQFQLTINVSALTITFLGILIFGVKAPFTVLQLLWINVIMDTLASIALCSEPPRKEVMDLPPKRRDENILTPGMVRNIVLTGGFFVVVMLTLLLLMKGTPENPGLLAGDGPWSVETAGNRFGVDRELLKKTDDGKWHIVDDTPTRRASEDGRRSPEVGLDFTVHQVSLFFSIYVFFQVWNQINCRSLRPNVSGLANLGRNPAFLAVAVIVAVGQVCIVTFGGNVFKVEPLSPLDWLGVIAFTSSVLVFAEIVRRIKIIPTPLRR